MSRPSTARHPWESVAEYEERQAARAKAAAWAAHHRRRRPFRALAYTDFTVADGNWYASRDGWPIDTVVIHTTVGSLDSAIRTFGTSTRQVSAHWIVALDGSLWRGVEEPFTAYHSGDWITNLRSIGIEHVDDGLYDDPRPDSLYLAAGRLLAEIRARYPISRIVRHREVSATRCPSALDVERIIALSEGGVGMALTAEDKAYIDQRIRDIVLGEPQLTGYAMGRIVGKYGGGNAPVALPKKVSRSRMRPAHHQRGKPPKGHPVLAK